MAISRVAEILLKNRLVDEAQVRAAAARQAQHGGRLARHLVELGYLPETMVAETLARALGMERAELGAMPRDAAALAKLDGETAERLGLFPCALKDGGRSLLLAMADPTDIETADFLAARTKCRVRPLVAGESEILEAVRKHYGRPGPSATAACEEASAPPSTATDPTPASPPRLARLPNAPTPHAAPPAPRGEGVAAASAPDPSPYESPPTQPEQELTEADVVPAGDGEEVARLRREVAKVTAVLRGLVDLCVAKGYFTEAEMKATVAKRSGSA